jgi:serine/threonine protein phosphatase PrpC
VHITCAARTDVGLIRSGNEDNYLMVPERGTFIVADGMGGHAAGEVASEMAVRIISGDLGSFKGLGPEEAATRMINAIRQANAAIYERTLSEHDKRGMGTTTTALALHGNRYLVGQVGDSRGYLLRDGVFHQLTKDHSYVQEQVDLGYLTPEQARTHPYANVITRCVGASADVMPDIFSGTVRPGDVFLLASDGLTGMVEDDALAGILQAQGNPEKWVDKLVSEANRRGGLDNITCIIVHVDQVDVVTPEMTTTGEAPASGRLP